MTEANDLKNEIMSCTACGLWKLGDGPVPFYGKRSRIMVVGEAPGRTEDDIGRPLVGPAGKLLWRELHKVGIERKNVLRANAVSCWPQGTPTEDQMYACRGNLYKQVQFCNPDFILALGRVANHTFGIRTPMNKLHGVHYALPWFEPPHAMIYPTYHPAAVLRNKLLTRAWREDLKEFADLVGQTTGKRKSGTIAAS